MKRNVAAMGVVLLLTFGLASAAAACTRLPGPPQACDDFFRQEELMMRQAYDRKKIDEQMSLATQAIALDPKDPQAFASRGYAYFAKGDYLHAIEDLSMAIQLDPSNIPSLMTRARVYSEANKWEPAIADYTEVIAIDPKNWFALEARSNLFLQKGDLERANADAAVLRTLKSAGAVRTKCPLEPFETRPFDLRAACVP